MEIIGHGMIARSLLRYRDRLPQVIIFASGVANSRITDPVAYEREYVMLYDQLRSCSQSNKRLVYFSSAGAVHGPTNALRDEMTPTFPTSIYGRHKLLCEAIIENSGASYLIMRLANLVGHTQNQSQLIPALIHQIKNNHVTLFANATRDLLDVEDFASILVSLLELHDQSDLITVASGYSIPVLRIAEELQQLLGLRAEFEIVDGGDEQRFSVEKLEGILSQRIDFNPAYYKSVLSKYATQYLCK